MANYKCKKCGASKELRKATLVIREGRAVPKEAYCLKCELYMVTKNRKGMPSLIRTEPTLKKS